MIGLGKQDSALANDPPWEDVMTLRRTVLKISAPTVDDHPAADRSL